MVKADCDLFRDWASAHVAAVRQRTVRQETTMAKHGTLPEFMYQRNRINSDQPVDLVSDEECKEQEEDWEQEDQIIEYDEEETCLEAITEVEISSSATFLVGATSRFGRSVRVSNRLLM